MKHTVDIETWERRDNYAFFRNFLNSWISVATEIDCTEARAAAKAAGRSFFLYYLYAVLRAVNEIKEFRYMPISNASTPRPAPSSPTFRRTVIPTAPKRCCRRRAITTSSC